MSVDPLDMQKMTEGKLWCHRTPPMFVPRELQRIDLVRLACIREQCPLWDAEASSCRDVTNAKSLLVIAASLRTILDHLPPELP